MLEFFLLPFFFPQYLGWRKRKSVLNGQFWIYFYMSIVSVELHVWTQRK